MPQLALMLALKRYQQLMALETHMNWVPKQENSVCKPENIMVGYVESTIEYKCWDCGVKTLFGVVKIEPVSPLYSRLVLQ